MNEKDDHDWKPANIARGRKFDTYFVPGQFCKRCGQARDYDDAYNPKNPLSCNETITAKVLQS